MGGIFSCNDKTVQSTTTTKPKTQTISDVDRAILDLKNTRDKLTRYRKKLNDDQAKLLQRAKTCRESGNDTMCLGLLRLRKFKMNEATKVENQLLTVMEMVDSIQGKEQEKELMSAMKSGKEALQKLHDQISVDEVLDLMDGIKEQGEVQKQINDIISEGVWSTEDEMEVEAELEQLRKEMEPNKPVEKEEEAEKEEEKELVKEEKEIEEEKVALPEVPDTPLLPTAPTTEPATTTEQQPMETETAEKVMVAS